MIAFAAPDEYEQIKVDSMRPSQVFCSRTPLKVAHGEDLDIEPVWRRRAVASPLDFICPIPKAPERHCLISTIFLALFTVRRIAMALIITIFDSVSCLEGPP